MAINFAAASTAGLNNPSTEIITLVKDGSGAFINPPSYDKMRAYLRSGEVPMLFVTAEGGETGNLYQLDEYSETENKIRFSNGTNTIAFSAGAAAPVEAVSTQPDWNQNDKTALDYVKNRPIYEKDGIVLPEQSFNFTSQGVVLAQFEDSFVESAEYKVTFDGTEYTCIYANHVIGDFRFEKYPFAIVDDGGALFGVAATASTHTLGLSGKTVHTLSERFLPHSTVKTMEINFGATEDELVAAAKHFKSGGVLYLSTRLVNYITGNLDSEGMTFWTQQLNATFSRLSDGSITQKKTYVLTEFPIDGVAHPYIYLASSTKTFKITVDDSGTISATEVT